MKRLRGSYIVEYWYDVRIEDADANRNPSELAEELYSEGVLEGGPDNHDIKDAQIYEADY